MSSPSATIRILRIVVRTLVVALALSWFAFALLSGAVQHGQGIVAVLRNWPNVLPWLAFSAIVCIAFRWELVGGILIALSGLASMVFFNVAAAPVVLFAVSIPLVVLGGALVLCWVLSRSQNP